MINFRVIPFATGLAAKLRDNRADAVSIYWLGQAGFVIDAGGRRIVIDPYLSDSLAAKYRDTAHPHTRMTPAPLTPDELGEVDLVLCTHQHTDHMDGETLRALAARLPSLNFVVPAASESVARQRIGTGSERLTCVDAGQRLQDQGFEIHVLRAAHETLERDTEGRHRFLGYGLDFGGIRLFHSGDTIPFEGQNEEVGAFRPDMALLPVNGRSEHLKAAGFAGNFSLEEAITLCERIGISAMLSHHYGMFAFNTIAPGIIDAASTSPALQLERARFQMEFRLELL